MIITDQILVFLERQPRRQATYKQLLAGLSAHGRERNQLRPLLGELLRRKKIIELRHAYRLAPERETPQPAKTHTAAPGSLAAGGRLRGRISLHADGFGFVLPDRDSAAAGEDVFIPPPMIGGAMHGDTVEVELVRAHGQRRAGKVMRILRRQHATVVGTFHATPRENYIQPFDFRLAQRILIPPGAERPAESGELHRVYGSEAQRSGAPSQAQRSGAPSQAQRSGAPSEAQRSGATSEAQRSGATSKVKRSGALSAAKRRDPSSSSPPSEAAILPPAASPLRGAAQPGRRGLEGLIVEAEITDYGSPTRAMRGRLIEVLGERDEFGVDVEIIIRKHHLPHRFTPATLEEAQRMHARATHAAGKNTSPMLASRRDFRRLPIVTIDGETARDFDDAIYVERLPGGAFALQVHIADVAHYVQPDSELDREARLRGTSVYFPDRAIPMLPAELSTDLCSLRPLEERLVMSCLMEVSAQGEIVAYEIVPGVIRSAARLTYTRVNQQLQAPSPAADLPQGVDWEAMLELQRAFYRKRQRDGSIDFDLPEPEIAFDEFGLMRSIVKSERNQAHRLIEEYMLAANQAVALHLERHGGDAIYRIHEMPEAAKIMAFEEIAASFGYTLGAAAPVARRMAAQGRQGKRLEIPLTQSFRITPRHYQQLTAKISGRPEERILSYLMLRSLPQARYNAENQGHFALAMATYTHFTSPIRRYPDLLVHRILKQILPREGSGRMAYHAPRYQAGKAPRAQGETAAAPASSDHRRLRALAREASDAERRAEEAERELLEWKKVRFMEKRMGERFPALIVNATKQGLYVELLDLFIEGLVPAASLEDDLYRFHAANHAWAGQRSRKQLRIGEHLEVLVERIDPVRNRLHFALAAGDQD